MTKHIGTVQRLQRPRVEVRVSAGPDRGQRLILGADPVIVGTSTEADLCLTDETVSARHCELSWQSGRLVLRDLHSTNGVLVDGVAVSEAFPSTKAKLTLAQTTLVLKPLDDEEVLASGLDHFGALYGQSATMRTLFSQLDAVAQSSAPVLLEGETGTGKDLTALAIHRASARAGGPFVVFDCGATSATLLESELFGHERGAFTGANVAREGLATAADGGTLFIDEIGELPLDLQPKLLRLLERREVRALGSNAVTQVDVRIVAATHRSLKAMVKAGTFREDLYYRLSTLKVRLPALRERGDDIPGLVDKLLSEQGSKLTFAQLAESDRVLLTSHRWPGNVRELRNVCARLIAFPEASAERLVDPEPTAEHAIEAPLLPLSSARESARDVFERQYVRTALKQAQGNVSEAARRAEVSRQFFQRLMKKYGLSGGDE